MKTSQTQPGHLAGNALNLPQTEQVRAALSQAAKRLWAAKKQPPVTLDWGKPCKR